MNTETKSISRATALAVMTGCGVPGTAFGDVHEAIEHLCGHPVWTHQLAMPQPWDRARAELARQHHDLSRITRDGYKSIFAKVDDDSRDAVAEEWVEVQSKHIPDTLTIAKGPSGKSEVQATVEALADLADIAGDKPVIVAGIQGEVSS